MRQDCNRRIRSLMIFENCIEKNFHVPNMRAVVMHSFRVQRRCNFESRNELGHTGEYLGSTGDEGRAKLRKA